ncbi:MAG: phosphoglucosamine mutase [Oscillospiraceae bacterium]|nr:phosphoglucosamine mutase [Oscillospiraceae bacterium]
MGRLFGTDGARGVAVTELTCETAMQIGRAAAAVLCRKSGKRAKVLIGKDTRISSDIMEAALTAGLLSVGADVSALGVVPTPAVAYLVGELGADAGIMISASHNSMEFNGIKLFAGSGYKLSDDVEEEIEALVLDTPEELIKMQKSGADVGRLSSRTYAADLYVKHVLSTGESEITGLTIAVDCANGSASATAEKLFAGLGSKVYLLSCEPDGVNINDNCGSTHLEQLIAFVRERKCDLGIAFDGDADRCLAVDSDGNIVDGDKLIAIFSKDMKERGILKDDTAVVTVLTNLGFTFFADDNGIKVNTTKVGDRYIIEQMLANGYNMGGEQSGHIIFHDFATTGDGELTAIQLLSVMKRTGRSLAELAGIMERYPQVMVNVKIAQKYKEQWKNIPEIEAAIVEKEKQLDGRGRILVRESGTEPLIRVMIEGKDFDVINEMALEVADKVRICCPAD